MDTKKNDKYANYIYKIDSETERQEAEWLISQGDFKDMNDFIASNTRAEIRYMKEQDALKRKRLIARKKRATTKRKQDAA